MSLVSVLRFVGGVAMVAGGVVLCSPVLQEVASAVAARSQAPARQSLAPAVDMPAVEGWAADAASAPAVPVAAAGFPEPESQLPADSGLPVRSIYAPPLPPPALAAPLPAAAVPEVEPAYRSMLDIPPPDLLDAQRPPSQVSWSAGARPADTPRPLPDALVPASCVVRDGDDLEGIATRYYGHPSAAGAIWNVNRERLADPRVLPIGLELRLPPPWTVVPAGGDSMIGAGTVIEPPGGGLPGLLGMPNQAAAASVPAATFTAAPSPWLARPEAAPSATAAAPPRPAVVQVAPGETLVTIARRFYGDDREAERIWQANRDRLRSPALVVPGMELRLP